MADFCEHCRYDGFLHGLEDKSCEILLRSLAFEIEDEKYPVEWIYDENGNPTCTKYKYHNWAEGKPEPEYNDPNQEEMFNKN